MSSSLTDGGSGEIGGEEATPSNATFQMLPPDDNILSVGTDEPYQSIQDAINYINEKQKGSDEAKEEDCVYIMKEQLRKLMEQEKGGER